MKAHESPSSSVVATPASPPVDRAQATQASQLRGEASPSLWTKAVWCVVTGALFFACYGACLHITAARAPVPTLAFAWERHVPFVPALIVPYLSIDLLFCGAFFLCTTRRELRTLVVRLAMVIGIAAVCFLLFPLQMASHRPVTEGFWGLWFASLAALDRPYNLAPSLHIAQATILLVVYARHTRGWLRAATAIWFALIFVSTLLTWQHHAFDVITGQALGLTALYLVREREPRTSDA